MILVTGANGHFAGAVIENVKQLIGQNEKFAVTTRDPGSASAQALINRGVEVRRADFNVMESVEAAFRNIDRVLMVSTVGPNDVRLRLHLNAIEAAKNAGVKHLIYTSFINAAPDAITEHSRMVHFPTEQKIKDSGLDYTILRHTVYADAILDDLDDTLRTGRFRRPFGKAQCAYIARDDLALGAATVLVDGGHVGKTYTETMLDTLSNEDIAALMSEAFDKDIRHEEMPLEDWPAYMMEKVGLPLSPAKSSAFTLQALGEGEFDLVTNDYKTITGRAPITFKDYLQGLVERRGAN